MVKFRHGFKTEAEAYAKEYREELKLGSHAPLCPIKLANLLDIPVFGIQDSSSIPDDITQYWASHSDGFSGLIIEDGTYKEIHHNDFHHPRRQNSNIAHELAHIILGHDLSAPIRSNGERAYDSTIETEAKWLGATLLLPKKATFHIVLNNFNRTKIEEDYQVSFDLFQYRRRVTDTDRMVKNYMKKHSLAL